MSARRKSAGYGLVEMLAACAIVGGCLVAACAACSRAGRAIFLARAGTQATLIARDAIEAALATARRDLVTRGGWDSSDPTDPDAVRMAERVNARLPGGHAKARFVPLSADEGVRIEVTVAWSGIGGMRQVSLHAVRF